MTFGEALEKMEAGAFVAREGWNGKNQFIYMTEGSVPTVQDLRGRAKAAAAYARRVGPLVMDPLTNQEVVPIPPHIDMFTEQGTIVCGWLASQTDMTATDWYVRDYAQNNQEATERLEPHVFAAMEYEARKKKQAEEKDCKDCANSIDEKTCTGDKEHGWVDTTGKKRCFTPKEPVFPQCPYNNTGSHMVCINREKNRCTAPDTHCFKSAAEQKEEEDGTQSN